MVRILSCSGEYVSLLLDLRSQMKECLDCGEVMNVEHLYWWSFSRSRSACIHCEKKQEPYSKGMYMPSVSVMGSSVWRTGVEQSSKVMVTHQNLATAIPLW